MRRYVIVCICASIIASVSGFIGLAGSYSLLYTGRGHGYGFASYFVVAFAIVGILPLTIMFIQDFLRKRGGRADRRC